MAAFSLRGYWRTLMERIAWTPAMMITRFTTMARTGRRMNRSVNLMPISPHRNGACCPALILSPVTMSLRLALGRLGLELRLRRQRLVQRHGHPVPQLEGPGAHHPLPR